MAVSNVPLQIFAYAHSASLLKTLV